MELRLKELTAENERLSLELSNYKSLPEQPISTLSLESNPDNIELEPSNDKLVLPDGRIVDSKTFLHMEDRLHEIDKSFSNHICSRRKYNNFLKSTSTVQNAEEFLPSISDLEETGDHKALNLHDQNVFEDDIKHISFSTSQNYKISPSSNSLNNPIIRNSPTFDENHYVISPKERSINQYNHNSATTPFKILCHSNSYEINPDNNSGLTYAYKEVTRGKMREKLHGMDCKCCHNVSYRIFLGQTTNNCISFIKL